MSETLRVRPAEAPPIQFKNTKPVKVWAAVGVAFVLLILYSVAGWILSGNATPTSTGSDPVPTWMKWSIHSQEVVGFVIMVFFVHRVLIRPWRREGHITLDGLFVLVFFTLWFQDPFLNWTQTWLTYNAELLNFGSWTSNVPGWISPNGHYLAEPLWNGSGYLWLVLLPVMGLNLLMRKAQARWPSIGRVGLFMVVVGAGFTFDIIVEPFFMRLGMWSYPGGIKGITLNYGHYYQYPLNVGLLTAVWFAATACLRYFKDDRGRTFVERGIDDLQASSRQKTGLRFLALLGAVHAIMLITFNVPQNLFALHSGAWPRDVTDRSYLTTQICGKGTTYACGGPGVPIPRRDSAHLGVNGELVPASPQR